MTFYITARHSFHSRTRRIGANFFFNFRKSRRKRKCNTGSVHGRYKYHAAHTNDVTRYSPPYRGRGQAMLRSKPQMLQVNSLHGLAYTQALHSKWFPTSSTVSVHLASLIHTEHVSFWGKIGKYIFIFNRKCQNACLPESSVLQDTHETNTHTNNCLIYI